MVHRVIIVARMAPVVVVVFTLMILAIFGTLIVPFLLASVVVLIIVTIVTIFFLAIVAKTQAILKGIGNFVNTMNNILEAVFGKADDVEKQRLAETTYWRRLEEEKWCSLI
ncbi:hypothetical protein Z517_08950 [Fonsecaea pedrosoi CBS 271.37]|uniref:Unplaced genomic scaffold supercont1.5, whole genome shotgun sequence n=1 Tax=Fonsecaea pedrosoi CBS 271.37 TaxID=1442368 RepID=A0A0D2GKT0_9EURO|nr:uncharacterized protein Z517_08950 [Fonsecaea pedrosoi CBS 271.37]KIW79110.1 hypothetical protein Z517_08950 [Fonsecaea pedrosoi CBS 271.37]